jgi:hypothetical protein
MLIVRLTLDAALYRVEPELVALMVHVPIFTA